MSSKRKFSTEVPINNRKPEDEKKSEEIEAASEKPNKRSKLSELTNMDPLEYFARFLDIPEMILKHLSGKDLIEISEVNPSWYIFIASSKVLMEKLKVVFDRDIDFNGEDLVRDPKGNPSWYFFLASSIDLMEIKIAFRDKYSSDSEDLLKNSSRLYQNIEVRRSGVTIENGNGDIREVGDYVTNSELDFFHSKAHEWKNVSLDNVYFRKKMDLWKLFSSIESSVESIFIAEFGFLSFEDPSSEIDSFEAFKFPKLKKLSVELSEKDNIDDTLARFFLNSVAIEEFDLTDFSGEFGKDFLTKILENCDKLKSLNISSGIINQIFEDESWKKFQFKLKSLSLFCLTYLLIGTNVLNFLKTQSVYLEQLKIDIDFENREFFDEIMKMPKMKSLFLRNYRTFSEKEVPTKMSTSITELILFNDTNAVSIKFVLDSMPKVTKLLLFAINEEIFQMLKSTNRKFEELRVFKLEGVDIEELEEIMTENYTSLEIDESILNIENYFLQFVSNDFQFYFN